MKHALITGANRGIGLEFCRQLKKDGWFVIAVCRQSSKELQDLGVRVIEAIDVTDEVALDRLADQIEAESLDLLINNAGLLIRDELETFNADDILRQFEVNALAPLLLTRRLLGKMKKDSKIAMITSRMGSIEDNGSGGYYGYRASKAALNAFSKSLSIDLRSNRIAIGILHPGFVQTNMTAFQGDLTPAQSAEFLLKRIEHLNLENTGTFWHCMGESLPW